MPIPDAHLETRIAQAGCEIDPRTGAVTPPIHLTTTFERAVDGSYPHGFTYARWGNPTRNLFEETLADLEGGEAAAAFGSGMAAASTVLMALKPGDHLVVGDDVYHTVRAQLRDTWAAWGLTWTEVDQCDVAGVTAALRPQTRLVWIETPSNPMGKIADIAALAAVARAHGAALLVDGTWTTPYLQRPLELGADLVLHSVTKYLAGHSDVLCGAVVSRSADHPLFLRIRALQAGAGAVAAPFDCWLALRGMRSLAARIRLQCESARRIADFLLGHARVARVYYPGLPGHPGHAVAARQMTDFGAMLSFEVDGREEDAIEVAARVRVFTRATSLGGTESLIEHRASIESQPTRTPPTLLRLSVGLESADDLIEDLVQALDF